MSLISRLAVLIWAALASTAVLAHAQHEGHDAHANHRPAAAAVTRSTPAIEIPDLSFVRQDGRKVQLRDEIGDGPVFVNFVFTTCTSVCPVMSRIFAQAQPRAGDARFVSISVDPLQDTPARLADYAKRLDAAPTWRFLTGTTAASVAAQKAFATYTGDKMNHPVATFFKARGQRQWVRIDGFATPDELLRELGRNG